MYKRAAWKQTVVWLSKFSSKLTWIPIAASGFTLAKAKRSGERTKKLPWKECNERPKFKKTR